MIELLNICVHLTFVKMYATQLEPLICSVKHLVSLAVKFCTLCKVKLSVPTNTYRAKGTHHCRRRLNSAAA